MYILVNICTVENAKRSLKRRSLGSVKQKKKNRKNCTRPVVGHNAAERVRYTGTENRPFFFFVFIFVFPSLPSRPVPNYYHYNAGNSVLLVYEFYFVAFPCAEYGLRTRAGANEIKNCPREHNTRRQLCTSPSTARQNKNRKTIIFELVWAESVSAYRPRKTYRKRLCRHRPISYWIFVFFH